MTSDEGSSGAGGPAPIPVRFAVDHGGFAAQVWVAEELGYFDEVGIDARMGIYSIGADAVVGLLAGREDFGVATGFPILAANQGAHMKIVSTIARADPGFYQFAATSGIREARDLVGKTVGVHQGTNQEYVTIKFLEKHDVDPADVKILPFGGQFEIVAAMRSGDVDAAWVWGVGVDEATKIDGVEILVDDRAVEIKQYGYLAASARFLDDHPEALDRILIALKRAADFIEASESNMRTSAGIVAAKQRAPVDTVFRILAIENYTVGFTLQDRESLQQLAEWQREAGILPSSDITEFLDTAAAESID